MYCQVCRRRLATYVCRRCYRRVCDRCIRIHGLCVECSNDLLKL
ncbi:MAG: hypothetical protein QXH99_07770 [Sulfolobales archaeon]